MATVSELVAWLRSERGPLTGGWPTERDLEIADALEGQAVEVARLKSVVGQVEAENERLRAALAHSDQPCAYCSLPADEWSKCKSGFPGCGRADDAMGCPELGASLRAEAAEAALRRIADWEPATQEMTIAHQMAAEARAALQEEKDTDK